VSSLVRLARSSWVCQQHVNLDCLLLLMCNQQLRLHRLMCCFLDYFSSGSPLSGSVTKVSFYFLFPHHKSTFHAWMNGCKVQHKTKQ